MLNQMTRIRRAARYLGQSLRLMVGVPEYSTYVTHMQDKHPDRPVMTYKEFFRESKKARYEGIVGRC